MDRHTKLKHRDTILNQLEEDYIQSIKNNKNTSVESFVSSFLYDSWTYNDQNIKQIKTVFTRYSNEEISKKTISNSFNRMIDQLRSKLQELDIDKHYPLLYSTHGTNTLVALIDGLVIQYYLGVYDVERLRELTPYFEKVILQILQTEVDHSS